MNKFKATAKGWFEVNNWMSRVLGIESSFVRKSAFNKVKRMTNIQQERPPKKGAFVYMTDQEAINWTSRLKNRYLKQVALRARTNPAFKELYDYEKFQSTQKGPVQKVDFNELEKSIEVILENSQHNLVNEEGMIRIRSSKVRLMEQLKAEGFYHCVKASMIQPVIAWANMDSSSVRGVPDLVKGNTIIESSTGKRMTIDEAICLRYGNDMATVVNVISTMKAIIGMPGLRLQGRENPLPAKVRIIFMPEVPEQYGLRAVQYPIQEMLKNSDSQLASAWRGGPAYWKAMERAFAGQNKEFIYLSLDYSKFDARMSYQVRCAAMEALFEVFLDDGISWKKQFIEAIKHLWVEQYMLVPDKEFGAAIYQVMNLLTSGDVMTQLEGTCVNRMYQFIIYDILGIPLSEIPPYINANLGDDLVLGIPVKYFKELGGYEKVLKKISDGLKYYLEVLMNDKKQFKYPWLIIFLQRAYDYPRGIIGEYSITRAIDSLVWAERFRNATKGVYNYQALETIGQLALLNLVCENQGEVTDKDLLGPIVVSEWLDVDTALCELCQEACVRAKNDFELAGAYMFSYLTAAAGGKAYVVNYFGLEQFDQFNLLRILRDKDSLTKSLPILSLVCQVAEGKRRINSGYIKVYRTKGGVSSHLIDEYMSEKV